MKKQAEARIPTKYGLFTMIAYAGSATDRMPHIAFVSENFDPQRAIPLRIHSECLTGDVFGSKRCDCGDQLEASLSLAAEKGGVVIYLRQEGRGIGLINKLKAYQLQDQGLNTADANTHLGFDVDSRQYEAAIAILHDLGISKIELITNNPLKVEALKKSDIEVVSRIPLIIPPDPENRSYLQTKQDLMGHILGL